MGSNLGGWLIWNKVVFIHNMSKFETLKYLPPWELMMLLVQWNNQLNKSHYANDVIDNLR